MKNMELMSKLGNYSYFRILFFNFIYFIFICLQFRAKLAICSDDVVSCWLLIYCLLFVAIKHCFLLVYVLFILLLYLLFLLLFLPLLLFHPHLRLLLLLQPIFSEILLNSTTNNRIIIASHTHFLELSSKMLNNETMWINMLYFVNRKYITKYG